MGTDETVWKYAKANDLIIVSKDADFYQWNLVYGYPPKVIWIRRGNCSTNDIENILRKNYLNIEQFVNDTSASILILT